MKHFFIDRYSNINSFLQNLDPRIKIITFFGLILFVILTPPVKFLSFVLYATVIAILILISRIPFSFIFKRSLVIIPFVLMIAIFIPFFKKGEIAGAYSFGTFKLTVTYDGIMIFWNVLVKAYLSILSMTLLVACTKFSSFLKALEKMKFPQIFTMILSFMYRYIFLLEDELMKMRQAKEARSLGGSKWLHIKALSNMLGVLFIRGYERAEQVYLAMCARGFNGTTRTIDNFAIKMRDVFFVLAIISILAFARIIGS